MTRQTSHDVRPRWAQMGAWRVINSPLGVAVCVSVVYGLFILARLALLNGDVSRFIMAGPRFISPQAGATAGLTVLPSGLGYDGQFYYLLARNPFSPHVALPGASFDEPAYRAQRILYPVIVWALSLGGRPALTSAMLVVVNLAAIATIGALGATLARRLGVAPLWGALIGFYPGLLVSLAGDLGEPVALACALGALLCVSRRSWGWAALLFSLAALARETTVVIPLALLIAAALARLAPPGVTRSPMSQLIHLIPRADWRGAALAGLIPLLVALGWQGALVLVWGQIGALAAGGNNLSAPLLGLVISLAVWAILRQPLIQLMLYADVVYLLGLGEMTRRLLSRIPGSLGYVGLAWGIYAALMLTLSFNVWDFYWNFLRAGSEFGMLGILLLLTAHPRTRWITVGATLAVWLMTCVAVVGATAPSL